MTGCRRLISSLRSTPTPSPVRHFNEARERLRPDTSGGWAPRYTKPTMGLPYRLRPDPASLDTHLGRAPIPLICWAVSEYGLMDAQAGLRVCVESPQGRPISRVTGAFLSRNPGYDKGQRKTPVQNPLPRPLSPPCPCPATVNIHHAGGT